jgi:hypothetical protein
MKIKFQFNARSSGQGVPEALTLAKKCGGVLDNKFYAIEFDDPRDKNLERLFNLVGNLKGSVILVDDGEPVNAVKFFYAVNCQDKLLCKGACKHLQLEYYSVDQFALAHSADIKGEVLQTSDPDLVRALSDYLEPISDTLFKFDKQLFLDQANTSLAMEREFCEKFDFIKFTDYVNALPSEIELISPEELPDAYEERYEEGQGIAYILPECDIDDKLPLDSILRCSKAISLLSRFTKPNRIANSDVTVYSFPELNKIIFVKLIVNEVESYSDETNGDDEENEEILIITEEEGFFTVKSDLFELYFQIFGESDPNIEERLKKLRKL